MSGDGHNHAGDGCPVAHGWKEHTYGAGCSHEPRGAQTARTLRTLSRWGAWFVLPLILATWILSRESAAEVLVPFATFAVGFVGALAAGFLLAARAYAAGVRDGRGEVSS